MRRSPVRTIRGLSAVLFVCLIVAGCAGGDGPKPPPTPQSVKLTADTTPLFISESVQMTASIVMSDGSPGSGTIAWTTSDAAVMTVDGQGLARAVGEGTARITATSGALSASAQVRTYASKPKPALKQTALGYNVTSTQAEIETGTMTVTRFGGAAPLVVGDVVAGTAGNGFIRRVTAVNGTGPTQVVQTVQGKLSEAFDKVHSEGHVKPNLAAALRSSYLRERGTASWPKGVSVEPNGQITLSNLVINWPFNLGASVSASAASAAVDVSGYVNIDFQSFDWILNATFIPPAVNQIRVVSGLMFTSELYPSVSVTGNIAGLLKFPSYEKDLFTPKHVGTWCASVVCMSAYIRLVFYMTPEASVVGSVGNKIDISYGVDAGVDYYGGVWHGIWSKKGDGLKVSSPTFNVAGSVGLKVGIRPLVEVLIANVAGPNIGLDINAKAEAGLENNLFNWFYNVDAGVELSLGARATIVGIELATYSTSFPFGDRYSILSNKGPMVGVTMAPSSVVLPTGSSQLLTPTVKTLAGDITVPSGGFTCTSSAPAVATTSGCTVNGVTVGTATITATSNNTPLVKTTVPVTVVSGALIQVTPTSFAVTHNVSTTGCPQTLGNVSVINQSGAPISWTATRGNANLRINGALTWTVNNFANGTSSAPVTFTCDTQTSFNDVIVVTVRNAAGAVVLTSNIPVAMTINAALITLNSAIINATHVLNQTACPQALGSFNITNLSAGSTSLTITAGNTSLRIGGQSTFTSTVAPGSVTPIVVSYAVCTATASFTDDLTIVARNAGGTVTQTYSLRVQVFVVNPLDQLDDGVPLAEASPFVEPRRNLPLRFR
jgi:hypothetical protein